MSVGASWFASQSGRSVLLVAFGAMLGWAGSSVLHFYDRPPQGQTDVSAPAGAANSDAGRAEAARATPGPTPAEPPVLSGPSFSLLGGHQAPDEATLFCSVLVVDPSHCSLEARLRAELPTATLAGPEPPPPAAAAPTRRAPASEKKGQQRRRNAKAKVADPADPFSP